jgi:hypothetical protein
MSKDVKTKLEQLKGVYEKGRKNSKFRPRKK